MKIKARRLSSRAKYKLLTIFALPATLLMSLPVHAVDSNNEVNFDINIDPILWISIPSEVVSLELTPSPNAPVFGSESLIVSAATNNQAGYQLFLNADATSLTNTKANKDSTYPTLQTLDTLEGGYTEETFTVNRWGYRHYNTLKKNTSTGQTAGNYNAFASGEKLMESTSATVLDQTTLDFATKIDMTQPSGVYLLDLELSAVAKVLPGVVTINFHPGIGSGSMAAQRIQTGNSSTIKQNTFVAPNSSYVFAGWSTTDGGDIVYTDGATYLADASNQDSTLDLYAIWARPMQGFTKSMCQEQANETPITLTDIRDNTTYSVAYLKDGECWMLQNLKLGANAESYNLTSEDSDADGTFTLSGKLTDGKFVDAGNYVNDSSQFYCTDDYGCYYNWYTATAGSGTSAVASGNANYSICPKGWTLPTGGSGGQFQTLYNTYGSASAMLTNNPTTDKENTMGNMPGLLLGGFYIASGANAIGSYGLYWSHTAYSPQDSYFLYLGTSSAIPTLNGNRNFGLSVRCIAKPEAPATVTVNLVKSNAESIVIDGSVYTSSSVELTPGQHTISGNFTGAYGLSAWSTTAGTITSTTTLDTTINITQAGTLTLTGKTLSMQEFTKSICQKQASASAVSLTDSRDGKSYTAQYFADQCWMTKNLDLAGGTTLTPATSNVTSNYTLPASSTSGFSSDTTAYVYNSNSTTCSSSSPCYSYYSFTAATAGTGATLSTDGTNATQDICPKGWRLPTKAEFNTLRFTYTTGAALTTTPFNGVYAGYYYSGSFTRGGGYGYYWSSTVYGSTYAYELSFGSSSAPRTSYNYKWFGDSVRCVAQ